MNLLPRVKIVLAKAGQASGTTAVTSDVIDAAGYEGVLFVGTLATANAGNFLKAQQGLAADMSDAADLAGSKVCPETDGETMVLDLCRPQERYVRVVVTRTAATATGDLFAILYGARVQPTDNLDATTMEPLLLVSPDEGTA